jgi:hypothetical protein
VAACAAVAQELSNNTPNLITAAGSQMAVGGKRQIQHGKMPKNAKRRFKKRQIIFTPQGSRF